MHYDCTTCGAYMGISRALCPECRDRDKDGNMLDYEKSSRATQSRVEENFNVGNLDDVLEDLVNHPNHYKSDGVGDIECIDAIQAALTEEEFQGFCKGNNIKYTWRANRKQEVRTNIEKAKWYLNKLLECL